ncbi:unnamed protein product [Caenorhabditis sp. 36 PRJEB53466]|nr:unnamed protein product [Caenorhabditis sp. 36 PRJEB53466]
MQYQRITPKSAMQVRLHAKNTFTVVMVVGFLYLAYLIFFESGDGMPEIDVDLKDVISYAVLAVEMGGHAVVKVNEEKSLNAAAKGLTDEGKEELLTRADLISNHLILDILQRFPRLQIVSEEKASEMSEREVEPYRSDNYAVWSGVKDILDTIPSRRLQLSDVRVFVDPLDATQEFTEGLTEYVTVMACIVVDAEPVFGVIYRPFFNETIFGLQGFGVVTSEGRHISPVETDKTVSKVVVSRSHAGKVKEVIEKVYGQKMEIEAAGGSGYKTLRLVNGTAELYLHTTAIKKWDTCAGDAILRTMGGAMLDLQGLPLRYSAADPLLNKKGLLATMNAPNGSKPVLVPFTPYEWTYVRQLFRSRRISEVKECITILAMWISRTGEETPVAISCSHVLLEAIHADLLSEGMCESERYMAIGDLRSKHGFAIMRFVNYVNEMGQNTTVLRNMADAVAVFGIPKRVVEIRHAITHQTCPDISELRSVTAFCLEWLWQHFWHSDSSKAMTSGMAGISKTTADLSEFGPQDGREQQYVTTIRAFNQWRKKNRNVEDVEEAEVPALAALKQHLLHDAAGFLECFVRDGHLIHLPHQLKAAKWTTSAADEYTIPEQLQQLWQPVFHVIFALKLGAELIGAFFLRLRESHLKADSKNQITAYARMILRQFADAELFTEDDWGRVLDSLLPVAKHFNRELIDLVMIRCTKLSRKRRKQVHSILNISSPALEPPSTPKSSMRHQDGDASILTTPDGGVVRTVEDLQKLMKRERASNATGGSAAERGGGCGIELCDAEEWNDVPFGLTPDQRLETFTVVIEDSAARRKRKAFDTAITLDD